MKANWSIIPDFNNIEESIRLSEEYDASWEYNDFFAPSIYENRYECERRIEKYLSLGRESKSDTLHGVFYDIAATSLDSLIRNHSRGLMEQSMQIAERLKCKGVIFHTGLIAGLTTESYIGTWVLEMSEFLQELSAKYSSLFIYVENTFEKSPDALIRLMDACNGDCNRIKLCLDYAHAKLTQTGVGEWVTAFASYVGHIHINDNDLVADLHQAPGKGTIDFVEFKTLYSAMANVDCNILLELNGIKEQEDALKFMSNL